MMLNTLATLEAEPLLVSVIVPCFNNGDFLHECVASLNNGVRPDEIIIIDDSSTDNSVIIAKELASHYDNIKLIERNNNGGAAAARYDGFKAAKNNWVAIVDADDYIENNALLSAYDKAKDQDADMCVWNLWRFNTEKKWPQITFNEIDFPKTGRQSVLATLGRWEIHPLGVAKKELYLSAYKSLESENTHYMNADELITRLVFSKAKKVIFTQERYFYRVNFNSTTQKKSYKHLSTIHSNIWLLDFIKQYKEVHPGCIAKGIVGQTWRFHLDRSYYGRETVEKEIKYSFSKMHELAPPWKWLWRYPKHLIAYTCISLIYRKVIWNTKPSE